jgi:hypothetical protein
VIAAASTSPVSTPRQNPRVRLCSAMRAFP